jgi:hypothetical protein
MLIFKYLATSKKSNWGEAAYWLIWMVIGVLLPLFFKYIYFSVRGSEIDVKMFTSDGELIIYSAAFFVSGAYLILKDFKNRPFPGRPIFGILVVLGLFISASTYLVITVIQLMGEGTIINHMFVQTISLWIFPLACFISYVIVVFDNIRIDPIAVSGQSFNTLKQDFDCLTQKEKQNG